jgi:hypothetical protein
MVAYGKTVWGFISGISSNGWTAIMALGTWGLVAVTLVAVFWQMNRQREVNAVTLLVRLTGTWDSEQMRQNRERLKQSFLMKSPVARIRVGQTMAPIANFFELVGFFTRRGALREVMVWSTFSYYVIPYFAAMKDRIAHDRGVEDDPSLYTDFEWLYNRMQRRKGSKVGPTAEQLHDFISNEPDN